MIPDLTLSALENGFGHFGVASNNNKTRHVDTLGVNVDSKNSTLTCYVRNDETKEVLEFLNESGRISFFVGMITHEAYNFKGQFVEVINLSRDDLEASNIYRNKILNPVIYSISNFNHHNSIFSVRDLGSSPSNEDLA